MSVMINIKDEINNKTSIKDNHFKKSIYKENVVKTIIKERLMFIITIKRKSI